MSADVETAPRAKASTLEVLGEQRNGQVQPRWRRYHLRLVELRDALQLRQARLSEEAKDSAPNYSLHPGDAGTDQFDQDMALSVLSSDQSAITEIDQALDRIQQGTYGVCELTGDTIEPERLEAIPWTRFSLYAQELLERDGGLSRIQFAPRRTLAQVEPASEPDAEEGKE